MSKDTIYRSSHPDVLAAWDESQAAWRRFSEAMDTLGKELGRRVVYVQSGSRAEIIGVADDDECPGPLWRKKRAGSQAWVPNRSTRAGKDLDARLRSHNLIGLGDLPGMPTNVFGPGAVYHHGVDRFGDAIYVSWGIDHEHVAACGNRPLDAALWTLAKQSDYWLAVEANGEAAVVPAG